MKISPAISRFSISPCTARIVSCTWQNERVCSPVTVDLERIACKSASDEARNHHSVLALLPRADRVEEAGDDAVEVTLLVESKREELVHGLGVGIEPAALGDRAVDPAVVLRSGRSSRWSPYTSELDAISTRLPNFVQYSSTISVPWTFVTTCGTGCSTIRRTPTAAAR